jgi:pimeloyl-ACP methyl ester carboxylesterase
MMTTRCILPFALVLIVAGSTSAQGILPRFQDAPCAVPVPPAEKNVRCGYLTVAENRSEQNGRTIKLPIVILKTDNPDPKPDPVLKTLGGPGGSSLKMITGRRFSPWLKDRNYIIFEQRGTKFAEPSLQCPEVDAATIAAAKTGLDRAAARKAEVAAAAECYHRLRKSGIGLDSYNSHESAADIEDLRRALGLKKINLYGVSYSARLMLDVIRYFPAAVRSAVLESTLPPEVNYDEVGVDTMVRSLNVLFTGCRNDRDCNVAFPQLEDEFYSVVSTLNKTPLLIETKANDPTQTYSVKLDGDDFATWIVDYLFSNEPSATIEAPYVIHQAAAGNYVPQFRNYSADKLGGSSNSWAMRYSVWCSEEIPFERMSLIKAQSKKYARLKGYEVMALPDICSVWKVKKAAAVANVPVTSDIPTLVLGAEYDSYTDPQWGKAVAGRLKNSFYYEIPWAGHGPGFSVACMGSMVAAFIDDPGKAPPNDCIAKTRSQFRFFIKKQ